jgi:hypothetical protein
MFGPRKDTGCNGCITRNSLTRKKERGEDSRTKKQFKACITGLGLGGQGFERTYFLKENPNYRRI